MRGRRRAGTRARHRALVRRIEAPSLLAGGQPAAIAMQGVGRDLKAVDVAGKLAAPFQARVE
jgi:hypothetical protein